MMVNTTNRDAAQQLIETMWCLVDEVRAVIRTNDAARGARLFDSYPAHLVEAVCMAETGCALDGERVL